MTNDKTSTTFSYSQSFCSGRVSHQEKFTTRIHRGKKPNGKTSWVVHSQIPFAGFFLPRERSTESTQASSASSQSSGKSFYDKHRTNTYGSNRNSIKPQACRFRHNSQLLPTAASSKRHLRSPPPSVSLSIVVRFRITWCFHIDILMCADCATFESNVIVRSNNEVVMLLSIAMVVCKNSSSVTRLNRRRNCTGERVRLKLFCLHDGIGFYDGAMMCGDKCEQRVYPNVLHSCELPVAKELLFD
jgi:hypothetical protein